MTMHFNVKLPLDLVIRMKTKLDKMTEIHLAEMATLDKRIKMAGMTDAIAKQKANLREREKRLTVHYLIRALITSGINFLDKKPEELLTLIVNDSLKQGRPSGPRAA
jgi:hypothetical protein